MSRTTHMTEDAHARAAGTRDPDKLAAGLDSAGIVQATRAIRELDTTTRVYVKQWLLDSRHLSSEAAANELQTKFDGRLHPEDMRVETDRWNEDEATYLAMTNTWTVAGEWNSADKAESHRERILSGAELAFAAQTPDPANIRLVTLSSKDEHALKNYGRLKLPAQVSK